MSAKNPRVNTVLERSLYEQVRRLADMDGVSVSQKVRDLVREAFALLEDSTLAAAAAEREDTMNEADLLSHEDVWKGSPPGEGRT